MITTEITTSKGLEQAEKRMAQAKNQVALEKKKLNADKRKFENHQKYMIGGVVHKYFSDCYMFEEDEMNEILKVALNTAECKKVIAYIKAKASVGAINNSAESEVNFHV